MTYTRGLYKAAANPREKANGTLDKHLPHLMRLYSLPHLVIYASKLDNIFTVTFATFICISLGLNIIMRNDAGPISLQWALNQTVKGAFIVSREIVEAATTDDVAVAALAAVESFGATLAICEETETQIETGLRLAQGSRIVSFLKSKIGYMRGDCCEALSTTTGGVRFLALAAALSTTGHFEAAKSTRLMLKETIGTNHLLPKATQLQTLYSVMEHKMISIGFADKVMQSHLRIVDTLRSSGLLDDPSLLDPFGNNVAARAQQAISYPSPEAMAALVREFRNLHRLGDASKLEIRAGSATIWIITFTIWCIGVAPRVILKNGTILYEPEEGSKIDIWAFVDDEQMEIRKSTQVEKPEEIWKASLEGDFFHWSGMVSIEHYGRRDIQDCGWENGKANRAMAEAIVHSAGAVLNAIFLFRDHHQFLDASSESNDSLERRTAQLQLSRASRIKSFKNRIATTISEFSGLALEKCHVRELKPGHEISDLSNVQTYIADLKKTCPCPVCSSDPSSMEDCNIHWFEYYLSAITSKIVAIALIDMPTPVRLYFSSGRLPWDSPYSSGMISKVGAILFPDSRFRSLLFSGSLRIGEKGGEVDMIIHITELFHMALSLVGHDIDFKTLHDGRWVASASRGQVIYPHTFESLYLNPQSVLILDGGPGKLQHEGETYERVVGRDQSLARFAVPTTTEHEQSVDRLLNLIPESKLQWSVTPSNRFLVLTCGISGDPLIFNPFKILSCASQCTFASSCSHDPAAILEEVEYDAYYTTPTWDQTNHQEGKVGVVAVHQSEELRFYSLISGNPGVVRVNACLKCCVDLCRYSENLHYIVC